MSASDILLIERLNSSYASALDGLLPDSGIAWANTFTPDGEIVILDSAGTVIVQGAGTRYLIDLWKGFPEPSATRHWFNNLIIETNEHSAEMTAYVIAISIKNAPATIVRTGTYRDTLIKVDGAWKFRKRILTLDPASHV
jgi:SnoaL-like domain